MPASGLEHLDPAEVPERTAVHVPDPHRSAMSHVAPPAARALPLARHPSCRRDVLGSAAPELRDRLAAAKATLDSIDAAVQLGPTEDGKLRALREDLEPVRSALGTLLTRSPAYGTRRSFASTSSAPLPSRRSRRKAPRSPKAGKIEQALSASSTASRGRRRCRSSGPTSCREYRGARGGSRSPAS